MAEVFHIDHTQRGEFKCELFGAIAQIADAADISFNLKGLGGGIHGNRLQRDAGAAIVKAGLKNLNAPVAHRMINLNAGRNFLAGFFVVDHDVTGKQFRHAGRVILDHKFFQFNRKRQLLQKHTTGLIEHGCARLRTFSHQQIATESRVGTAQAVLVGHVGNQAAAGKHSFVVEPHLRANHQIAIEQTAQAYQHNGAVRRNVAELVGSTLFGGHHPACVTLLKLDAPAALHQCLADAPGGGFRHFGLLAFCAVTKGLETLLADVFFVVLELGQDFGGVTADAQAGAQNQKSQNQQKPPGAVNRVQAAQAEHLGPEGAELVDVVGEGFLLLEHRADDRCDADEREQGN